MSANDPKRTFTECFRRAKMRFQSFFMLITVQPSFFASSNSSCANVPTLVNKTDLILRGTGVRLRACERPSLDGSKGPIGLAALRR